MNLLVSLLLSLHLIIPAAILPVPQVLLTTKGTGSLTILNICNATSAETCTPSTSVSSGAGIFLVIWNEGSHF